jgi:hypothetical protein
MLINLLVAVMTVILLVFVIRWWLSPALRASIEQPKYAVAEWDGRDLGTKPKPSPNQTPIL